MGTRLENDVATITGCPKTPGSGCGKYHKGDNEDLVWLMEAKSTQKDKYRISNSLIEKLETYAHQQNKKWVIIIGFDGVDSPIHRTFAFFPTRYCSLHCTRPINMNKTFSNVLQHKELEDAGVLGTISNVRIGDRCYRVATIYQWLRTCKECGAYG